MVVDINNSRIYVWLSKGMYNDLKIKIKAHNENPENDVNFNLGIAAYFLNLPNYIGTMRKDKYDDGWIPICSRIYKNIKNSSKYFDFLIENGFLLVHPSNYSTETESCRSFKIGLKYNKQVLKFHALEINKQFHDKRLDGLNQRLNNAKTSTSHITKWLDKIGSFNVDYENAENYIKETFQGSNFSQKRNYRTIALDNLKHEIVRYSREGKDKRLHSILTGLPKDLKSFITYKNQRLASIDIKNCQPFILATLLDGIITNKPNKVFKEYVNKYIPNMFDPIVNKGEIREFINEITSGGYYYSLGDKLYNGGVLMTNCADNYYFQDFKDEKSGKYYKIEQFENRREAAKHIMMKILFTSSRYNKKPVQVFQTYYPEVYKIIKAIKSNSKSNLPILLQNIEADFILDYCTKKIANKYPEMPLFTIHDSIVTTENNIDILQHEFRIHLKEYFHILPSLKVEFWNNNDNQIKLKEAG